MARNRPTDAELIDAVVEFLAAELQPHVTTPDIRFKLRIAMNVLGIVARECRSGAAHDQREVESLQKLLKSESTDIVELNTLLCAQVRRGDLDARHDELVSALTAITMDKLSVDNPRYSTYKDLIAE
jgi:hypothetical protein